MRGMYTAGVLDVFLDKDVKVDGIIGVSAGVLFGVNYCSKQRGRAIRYNKRFCKDKNYMSLYSLIKTGNPTPELFEDLSLLLPTSGSTGSPKLVRHSYRNIEANAENVKNLFQITP
jgi:long-subunit acyl-CoA synthetase (AMP-forming)